MARQQKPATLRTTEVEALQAQLARFRSALTRIQCHAALFADGAHDDGDTTLASGFAALAGLASDALEGA